MLNNIPSNFTQSELTNLIKKQTQNTVNHLFNYGNAYYLAYYYYYIHLFYFCFPGWELWWQQAEKVYSEVLTNRWGLYPIIEHKQATQPTLRP